MHIKGLKKNYNNISQSKIVEYNSSITLAVKFIILLCFVILYVILLFIQFKTTNGSLAAIISQVEVMISIYLEIKFNKQGYITAVLLNCTQCITSIIHIIFLNRLDVMPGFVTPICTIIIVSLLYNNINQLNDKIAEILSQKEKLNTLAYFDSLTGIPNRSMILRKMQFIINLSKLENMRFVLVFIDLDDFKKINDSLGHGTGDDFLLAVISRICSIINKNDLIGRIGGDEFALLIQRPLKNDEIIEYIESIKTSLNQPFQIGNFVLNTSASFGVSIFPDDGQTSDELLKNADMAMYKVKSSGKNDINFFNKELKELILKKIDLENNLRSAQDYNEIYVVFQPQYTTNTKKLRGFEALVRWQSPKLGLINPDTMIPIAEETGIIISLGEWILKNACIKFKEISSNLNADVILSVNISTIQFMKPTFVDMVKKVLSETDFDPCKLELEVTESVFISSAEYAARIFEKLKEIGIHIALDDFGTGYSSLSYLHKLPIDILKIDKSFIDELNHYNTRKQIVGDLINLMHKMNIAVVAEGVETEKQLNYLNEHNCDFIQGFLWGKPLSETELKTSISWFS
ncbi:MAG: EAL domain-containing protein [Bacillota bacterium]|nr:EAL domain-containing protein [Bacillota bacterium]